MKQEEVKSDKSLVGRKMTGFRFESVLLNSCYLSYNDVADKYVGVDGTIVDDTGDTFEVEFSDKFSYVYPKSLAIEHLVPETNLEKINRLAGGKVSGWEEKAKKRAEQKDDVYWREEFFKCKILLEEMTKDRDELHKTVLQLTDGQAQDIHTVATNSTTSGNNLKACPFCGMSDFHVFEKPSRDSSITWYSISHGPHTECSISMMDSDIQKLINRWNKRA